MIGTFLKSAIPERVKRWADNALYAIQIYRSIPGIVPRQCPICGFRGLFKAFGQPPRYDALCPGCGSLERHRLIQLALAEHPLRDDAAIMHFAPEKTIAAILPRKNYRSADLMPGRGDLVLDIGAIALPTQSEDVIVANHVLEHVGDDRRALAEIFRVLRPGGLLLATVPMIDGWDKTYEDTAITRPADRELYFGQRDHVRYYGRDFRARVTEAGFRLSEFTASGGDCVRYALMPGETVFFGYKL